MRSFWLFRSDIKALEYYHKYTDYQEFINKCHDFYLLQGIEFLENGYFDEVIIWRVTDKPKKDIVFDIDGKKFIQRWVKNLTETLKYPEPDISFWRGGFRIYDHVTKMKPNHFGLKLYLGAGKRVAPQYGGKYDVILLEDNRDIKKGKICLPFYKTASPRIFYPMNQEIKYDICWPCNFTQIRYKGQELFIKTISKNPWLKNLKIIHTGNKPHVGISLCKKYGVKNIEFKGLVDRPTLNKLLNQSKFGLNLSNLQDGCPRVSTEILMSGTPLIIRDTVRLLPYFKRRGAVEVSEKNLTKKIKENFNTHSVLKNYLLDAIQTDLSFSHICEKNINLWFGQK
jgi:hypothetical protein